MIVRTRKLSDKKLVALIRRVSEIIDDFRVRGSYLGGVTFSIAGEEEIDEISARANEKIIDHFIITSGPHSDEVRFARGVFDHTKAANANQTYTQFINTRLADAYFDEVAIHANPNRNQVGSYKSFDDATSMAIARELSKLEAPVRVVSDSSSDAYSKTLDQNIADLQELSADFIRRMAEAREAEEIAFAARLEKLQSEYDTRTQQLESEKSELARQRKELDDREPQHERRRLRKDLTGQLSTYLSSPAEGSYPKRNAASLWFLAAGSVFLVISVILTLNVNLASEVTAGPFWAQTLKSTVSGLAGAAFIWAGLKGLNKSSSSEREYSQALQRYSFDMDRASWVVETLLQMNSIESAQVPDVWLQAACRDLFKNTHEVSNHEKQPLDALAALLDATAKARVGTDGFEFEIDKRAARRMAAQA